MFASAVYYLTEHSADPGLHVRSALIDALDEDPRYIIV